MTDYDALLLESYKGELLGDALFTAMAENPALATYRAKVLTLAEIEARTASVLRPLVDAAGIDAGDGSESRALGRELGDAINTWDDFLKALHDALPNFLADFVRLRELAVDPHHPAITALVVHEQTINAFCELELAGHGDLSHAVLTRYLETAP